jgi:cellulose synthase/poly-beta-1,6-N-acetylglucosamine synthase-like glycosyltransferase
MIHVRDDGRLDVTVIVPAYNEAEHVGETIQSLLGQALLPAKIVVVDDCSSDGTGDVARGLGAVVLRPEDNTGSKAGAQNFALAGHVDSPLTMILDADTVLAPDAIERLVAAFEVPDVAAACGFVIPRRVSSVWERGRYIEYLFAFSLFKQVQDFYGKPMISSGCLSMYRTDALRAAGGWSNRTMAEDMDLTWTLFKAGWQVRFIPGAVSYPVEPHSYEFMRKQLKRWSHAFLQNIQLHWRDIAAMPYLFWAVSASIIDGIFGAVFFLGVLPVLSVLLGPWFLLGYIIDFPVIAVPALHGAWRRGETLRGLVSLPAFFVLRLVNSWHLLGAVWNEWVIRRRLTVYEKGH